MQQLEKYLVVIDVYAPPDPARVQGAGGGADDGGLQIGHHGVADAGGEPGNGGPVAGQIRVVGRPVLLHLL